MISSGPKQPWRLTGKKADLSYIRSRLDAAGSKRGQQRDG